MSRDKITKAWDEWYIDAIKDSSRMPNRWEAFYAGWQACVEYYESGEQNNERVFSDDELKGRTDN